MNDGLQDLAVHGIVRFPKVDQEDSVDAYQADEPHGYEIQACVVPGIFSDLTFLAESLQNIRKVDENGDPGEHDEGVHDPSLLSVDPTIFVLFAAYSVRNLGLETANQAHPNTHTEVFNFGVAEADTC